MTGLKAGDRVRARGARTPDEERLGVVLVPPGGVVVKVIWDTPVGLALPEGPRLIAEEWTSMVEATGALCTRRCDRCGCDARRHFWGTCGDCPCEGWQPEVLP